MVAAVIAVSILVALSATSGDDSPTGATLELSGIAQEGDALGRPGAPVEIVEYADLQCPFCAEASREAVPALVDRYVRDGSARLVFRPLSFIGDDSQRGALAAAAAGEQGKMWQFVEKVFARQGGENSGWLSDALISEVATEVGLDTSVFARARTGDSARAAVARAAQRAQSDGISSTPTFVVSGPRGRVVVDDYRNLEEFDRAVRTVR